LEIENLRLRIYIALSVCVLCSVLCPPQLQAKKPVQPVLSAEQRQQFMYYWYAAYKAIDEERYTDAYVLLQFCNAIQPDDAQTLAYLGAMYSALGHEEQALEAFGKAYQLAPEKHWQRYLEPLKEQYIKQKNWKKALQTQDQIDKYNGYDGLSAITRYRIYAMSDKPKKALKAIDDYLETDPTNLRFLLFRIEIMEQLGAKKKELFAYYDLVLAIDPYNLMVLNNYAYYLATHGGDLTEAERMSAITIHEEPNSPVYLDTYGWILHLKGQDELALFYLQRALWNAREERTKKEIEKHIEAIK